MAGKKSDLGPIGTNLTHTLRRLREARRLGYAELSRQLSEMGREIPPLGLRRIETGVRRVDVDDLVALALALEVSPLALLLPTQPSAVVPQGDQYTASRIWDWARGRRPLSPSDPFTFIRDSNPLDWRELEAVALEEVHKRVLESALSRAAVDGYFDPNLSSTELAETRQRSGADEDEIAQQLSISGDRLAAASFRLWEGRTFSEERDRRAGPDANQQKRGRVSRELRAELEKALANGND